MSIQNEVVSVFTIEEEPPVPQKSLDHSSGGQSLQNSMNKIVNLQSSDAKQVQIELSNGKEAKEEPQPVNLVPNAEEDVEILQVTKSSSVMNPPQLHKHQAIDNTVPCHQVKVDLEFIRETIYFWESLTRCAKRRLLIFNSYIYSLEPQDFGYFVVGIWNLNELAVVKIWTKENKMRLIFKDDKGIVIKQKEFKPINMGPFKEHLRKELLRMGRQVM